MSDNTEIHNKEMNTTVCFRKVDQKWMVTHEHNLVPF